MSNWVMGAGNPSIFHITNLLIHILNSYFVFIIIKNISNNQVSALLTSFLFSIHPVMTESVVWLSARKDLLSTFFMLLAVCQYLTIYSKTKSTKRAYILFFIFYSLSLLSKVQYVTLPLLLILIDWFKGRKGRYTMYLEKIVFAIPALILGVININTQFQIGYYQYGYDFTIFESVILFLESISKYLSNLIFPVNLSIFYAYPFKYGENIPFTSYLFSFITLCIFICAVMFRKNQIFRFGLGWFLIQICVGILVSMNREFFIADRYNYGASIGIIFLISSSIVTIGEYIRSRKAVFYCFFICMIGWFIFISSERIRLWESPDQLFQNALFHYPESEILLNSIASIEIDKSNFDLAEIYLTKAIAISPQYFEAIYNRGILNSRMGNLPLALEDYTLALKINPLFEKALFARGNSFMKIEKPDEAIKDFTEVIHLNPYSDGAFQNRAILFGQRNRFDLALNDLNQSIKINPYSASAFYLRGIAKFKLLQDGCEDLKKSMKLGYLKAEPAYNSFCR